MQEMSDLFSTCEDEGDRAYIIKRVKECKGRGVLFILDGYDELPELPEHSMLIFKRKVFSEISSTENTNSRDPCGKHRGTRTVEPIGPGFEATKSP